MNYFCICNGCHWRNLKRFTMKSAIALTIALGLFLVSAVTADDDDGAFFLPPKKCPATFGAGCYNTCAKNNATCCYCEECISHIYGSTQTCSCCPKGFTCCNNYVTKPYVSYGGKPLCCPPGTVCRGKYCAYEVLTRPNKGIVVCSVCGGYMDFTLTCDNEITLFYCDNVLIPLRNYNDWSKSDTVSIPTTSSVLAVKLLNYAGTAAGFLASNTDGSILSNDQWRCTNEDQPSNWMTVGYDDSAWKPAVLLDSNDAKFPLHGYRPTISTSAYWIWCTNPAESGVPWGTVAYCRLRL